MDPQYSPNTSLKYSSTPNAKFNLSIKHVADGNWLLNPRPSTSRPPMPGLHDGNSLQLAPGTNSWVRNTLKREAPLYPSFAEGENLKQANLSIRQSRFRSDGSETSEGGA